MAVMVPCSLTNFVSTFRGFKRVAGQKVPANTVAYHHSMFQKGKVELLKNMTGGKKTKEPENQESMLQEQLARDFHGASSLHLSHMAGLRPGMYPMQLGGGLGGLQGPSPLLAELATRQRAGQPNSFDQELRLQSLFASQYKSEQALQRQVFAAEQAAMMARQQQQHRETSDLRMRLLQGGGLGGIPQHSDLSSRMLMGESSSPLSSQPLGEPSQMDPRLLQMYLMDQQRQQLPFGSRDTGGF